MKTALFLLATLYAGQSLQAMEFESIKMRVWSRGEEIAGEEFIAASESVADYLSTLERPTGKLETFKYQCLAKGRTIRPYVQQSGATTGNYAYVWIRTVYEMKDCQKIAD